MKKKLFTTLCCALLTAGLLCGCGRDGEAKGGTADSALASDWELASFTVNGETTNAADMVPEVRKKAPGFTCSDGVNCVFSNNGKDHPGTVKEENGKYVIEFDDTDQDMICTIDGDTLTIVNSKGTVTTVFKKK